MAAVATVGNDPHQPTSALEGFAPGQLANPEAAASPVAPATRVVAFAATPVPTESTASTPSPESSGGNTGETAGSAPRAAGAPHAITQWRLPSRAGKMPAYVEHMFRLKALFLVCSQLIAVLSIMLAIEFSGFAHEWDRDTSTGLLLFVVGMAVGSLVALKLCMDSFPVNYCLLVVVTFFAGFLWGIGGQWLPAQMHFQVMGIITGTMLVASISMISLARFRLDSSKLVFGSVIVGWSFAAAADAIIAHFCGIGHRHVAISIFVALGLFMVFSWEAGTLLVDCNPDSFMSVVIAMDASLMVVLAIPFLWAVGIGLVVTCCLTGAQGEPPAGEGEGV